MLDPAFIAKIEEILAVDLEDLPLASKWKAVVDVMLDFKGARMVKDVPCAEFLVHPSNRGNLGLNAYNAHRNGSVIQKIGADLQQLVSATAFEISMVKQTRDEATAFNEQLVKDCISKR